MAESKKPGKPPVDPVDPVVETDLLDYAPGATATITASDFIVGSTLEFQVLHVLDPGDDGLYGTSDDVIDTEANDSGEGHETWSVTDGGEGDLDGVADGNITTSWYVNPDDSLGATFLLTATDTITGDAATTWFTDLLDDNPTGNRVNHHEVWEIPTGLYTPGNVSGYREGDSASFDVQITFSAADQALIDLGDDGIANTGDEGYKTFDFAIFLDLSADSRPTTYAFVDLGNFDDTVTPPLPNNNIDGTYSYGNSDNQVADTGNGSVTVLNPTGGSADITSVMYEGADFSSSTNFQTWTVTYVIGDGDSTTSDVGTYHFLYGGVLATPGDIVPAEGGATIEAEFGAGSTSGVFQARIISQGTGDKTVPFKGNLIIKEPDIKVTKEIDRDGDGDHEDFAAAGEFSFTIFLDDGDGVIEIGADEDDTVTTQTLYTDANGMVLFENVETNVEILDNKGDPTGIFQATYWIIENQEDFPNGIYQFDEGEIVDSGTPSGFFGEVAQVTVAEGTTNSLQDASVIFRNSEIPTPPQGALDVEKYVFVDGAPDEGVGVGWVDADSPTGPLLADGSGDPDFKYVITNSAIFDATVTLTDSVFDLNGLPDDLSTDPGYQVVVLAGQTFELEFADATWQYGQHTNTASIEGFYPDSGSPDLPFTDSDDANYYGPDAKITITPLDATNQVGDEHVLTANVMEDIGNGFVNAEGEVVVFSIVGDATFVDDGDDLNMDGVEGNDALTDADGNASVTIVSNTTGENTVTASSDVVINSDITISRQTDGSTTPSGEQNSNPAEKTYVDARLSLSPLTDDNQVGDDHLITALLEFDYGDGLGFVAAGADEDIVFSLSSGVGALVGPTTVQTDDDGEATITLQSSETGDSEVDASWNGVILTATASTSTSNDQDAEKNWVDAKITISPQDATNFIGDPHLLTANVMEDTGGGFVNAAGEVVVFSIVGDATFVDDGDDLNVDGIEGNDALTDANGNASVTIVSNTPGLNTITASSDVDVNGLTVAVETDGSLTPSGGQNSDPAKKTYVDPIHIEKLVSIIKPEVIFDGLVCEEFGKPVEMTFAYILGNTVVTDQDSGKAGILTNNGVDDDGTSFVVVSDQSGASAALSGSGKQFFRGDVAFDEVFAPNEDLADFGSTTYIHFFDDSSGGLLQSVVYHTSCSQPIQLGDVIGNATLVDYTGETGTAVTPAELLVGPVDADDPASAPVAKPGYTAEFTYQVTNTGTGSLSGIMVTDDRLANVEAVDENDDGFNDGDLNADELLDPGEVWLYTASAEVQAGLQTNIGTVTGLSGGVEVSDEDPANYIGANAEINIEKLVAVKGFTPAPVCETFGKPVEMTFAYILGNTVVTDQDPGKAGILTNNGVDDDGTSFVVVSDQSGASAALSGSGKQFFRGDVAFDEEFAPNEDLADFGSTTYIHFFDDISGGLLQSVVYHTSCSQPINIGDVTGNATLVGYVGENGEADATYLLGEDADVAPGPEATIGTDVLFTYVVTNPGDTPLGNVMVTDDTGLTPEAVDEDNDGTIDGDTNFNGFLDPGETWLYTATEIAELGLQTNLGTAEGTFTVSGFDVMVMDEDPANYTGSTRVIPSGDMCKLGDPLALTFLYQDPLDGDYSDVNTGGTGNDQDGKAKSEGTPDDDGMSYIIVTDKGKLSDVFNGAGKIFFTGTVAEEGFFTVDGDLNDDGISDFSADARIYVWDDLSAFNNELDPLQTMKYHTSCSQPIHLGDEIGSVALYGYEGEQDSAEITEVQVPLHVAEGANSGEQSGLDLTQDMLAPMVAAAIEHWAKQGVDAESLDGLLKGDIRIEDLGGDLLGTASGQTVTLDDDAAGYGWSDSLGGVDANEVDLLSTMAHEFGHVLGYGHDVMNEALSVGERYLPQDDTHLSALGMDADLILS